MNLHYKFGMDEERLGQLEKLIAACKLADKTLPRTYWHIIKQRKEPASDIFCFDGNKLVGYLGIFLFTRDTAEFAAFVHPDYRRQKIFTQKLYYAACKIIEMLDIHKIIFSYPQGNIGAQHCVARLGAQFNHREYFLIRTGSVPEPIADNTLILRQADSHDVPLLVKFDAECFTNHSEYAEKQFSDNMKAANRQAWLAYYEGECVGKAHIRFDDDRTFIHDIAILPSKQKQGFGTLLLKNIINYLLDLGYHNLCLDVEASNEHALQLYQRVGFKIGTVYEYWDKHLAG